MSAATIACPVCGLGQTVGDLPTGMRAHCARCDAVLLRQGRTDADQSAFCFALGALLLFLPANLYPIIEVTNFGRTQSYTVLSGALALWQGAMWPLAIPVALASVVLPAGLILVLLTLSATRQQGAPDGNPRPLAQLLGRLCDGLRTWAIVDVYVLAIFVTVVKLAQLTDAAPDIGAALFFAMAVCLILALRCLDARPDLNAARAPPDPRSLTRTLAWALAALVLFVPANLYPTLSVTSFGSTQTATVFGGVVDLWQAGMWPLALIVVCASLLVPFFKIMGLLFLTLTIGRPADRRARTRLYLLIAQIGRWSMLDVYVISMLVAVLHLGALAGAKADVGSLAFVSVVIVTLIAARSFDPRLIWAAEPIPAERAPRPGQRQGQRTGERP